MRMEPLQLFHSWPLSEKRQHFRLGHLLNSAVAEIAQPPEAAVPGPHHAGCWECDLADNALTWSGGVYDIFALPRGVEVSREEAAALYTEESRAAMERLRAYAIKHRRGFTLDAEIRPAAGAPRWMRLIAAPALEGDRVVRLHGIKLVI